MAIARASWRLLVPSSTLLPRTSYLRLFASMRRPTSSVMPPPRTERQPAKSKFIKRFLPEEAKEFFKANGKLLTTSQNRDFLLKYDLEPDNGRMVVLRGDWKLSRAASNFSVTLAYSPRHVIHPFDLRYFDPRGHPLAPMKRVQYAQKTRQEPMWIMVTASGRMSAVARALTRRRLTRCIYEALHRLGYQSASQHSVANKIWGTLWVTIHDPAKAATQSSKQFGRVVADALVRYCTT